MENGIGSFIERGRRIRSALMVFCALVLFVAGLLLLLAPSHAGALHSRIQPVISPAVLTGG